MTGEYVDVVIVGAGLSGIGAARYLQQHCPGKRYLILEGRSAIGGTWDLFRYPGIRSDSDMHTLGYSFKPWREAKSIADGPSILRYINETAEENGIKRHIRFGHLVRKVNWSTATANWSIDIEHTIEGKHSTMRCGFLLMCAGYYSYEKGYVPEFTGRDLFEGAIAHPQEWTDEIDYRDKKVVVIGSGATAVTMVPEMAKDAAHVTMLQRSPTYMVSLPDTDLIANMLRKILPEKLAYAITRWKNIRFQLHVYRRTRTKPEWVRKKLLGMVRKEMGPDYDVETHLTPTYDPWDQRLCLVPNSDFFQAVRSGNASIVTDTIDTFTERGLRLTSGAELEADIIVTATGLNLVLLGGTQLFVDDKPVDVGSTLSYMGMMFSNVPNLISTFGYINASWTLRADLTAEYACRLINQMDRSNARQCTPRVPPQDTDMPRRDWITDFSAGYMQRAMHLMPKQGSKAPWVNTQNYAEDRKLLHCHVIDDGILEFSNPVNAEIIAQTSHPESDAA